MCREADIKGGSGGRREQPGDRQTVVARSQKFATPKVRKETHWITEAKQGEPGTNENQIGRPATAEREEDMLALGKRVGQNSCGGRVASRTV